VSDQCGSPTSAVDLAGAVLAVASAVGAGAEKWGTYHFAGAGVATRLALAARIIAAQRSFTGREPRLIPIRTADYPVPARRPANSALDTTRFVSTFGFRPRPWEGAVDEAVRRHFETG
jgi:dTDP-4-dehydrorhamnose reductase